MPKNLETDWLSAGRSGDTIDGRIISKKDVHDAADAYDPKFYTAPIWPEHKRWFRLGKVTQVKAENNEEGGADMFVKLQPNDYYLQMNAAGQRLHLSMELPPNFRKTGKAYLFGIGATDQPASVHTSEVIFSDIKSRNDVDVEVDDLLISQYTKHAVNIDTRDSNDEEPNWFKKFKNKHFSNNDSEADMSKADIEKLQSELTKLTEKVNNFTTIEKPADDDKGNKESKDFTALSENITALTNKFTELEKKVNAKAGGEGDGTEEHYKELKASLETLTKQFKAALEEGDGTVVDEEAGSEDLNKYV